MDFVCYHVLSQNGDSAHVKNTYIHAMPLKLLSHVVCRQQMARFKFKYQLAAIQHEKGAHTACNNGLSENYGQAPISYTCRLTDGLVKRKIKAPSATHAVQELAE